VSAPRLSVVIPAYNEAARLPATLARVRSHLEARGELFEIVVADDGSRDGTERVALAAGAPFVRVLRSPTNRGKGHAVRRGMLAATGVRRLMSDADLSTPIEELSRLEAELDAGYDVAIGSRALPGATIEVHQPRYREGMGRLFNWCVRRLLLPRLHDTQCGFKLFSAVAAETAFSRARLDGFCFDVEALFLAERAGYRIAERPVVWRNDAASRVTLVRGGLAFADLLRIRWNAWRGDYGPAA
jgi:glycosyltransferase involved in cell wall biosynthesis